VLAIVFESQQRGVFHPHIVVGYRTAADRAALDTFRDTVWRKRGEYGFGMGWSGSFDGGLPDRFTGQHAGRYISKYLRPDGAKRSFVPLLEAIARVTPRDPETGRLTQQVRPVYVSPILTRVTGVTMGFLRFRRWAYRAWAVESTHAQLRFAYELRRNLGAAPISPGPLPQAAWPRAPAPRPVCTPLVAPGRGMPVVAPRYVQLALSL
jgi:hypothetical protein